MSAAGKTPGQADEIPDAYTRYIRAVFPPEVLASTPNEITGRWKHMTGPAEREFWRSLDVLRAELGGLQQTHATLLEEILRNADEDVNGGDEAVEYLAEHYVRFLEQERDRLRELLNEARIAEPAPSPCGWWSDPSDDFYGACVKEARHDREGDPEHENEHGIRWTGQRWEGSKPQPAAGKDDL